MSGSRTATQDLGYTLFKSVLYGTGAAVSAAGVVLAILNFRAEPDVSPDNIALQGNLGMGSFAALPFLEVFAKWLNGTLTKPQAIPRVMASIGVAVAVIMSNMRSLAPYPSAPMVVMGPMTMTPFAAARLIEEIAKQMQEKGSPFLLALQERFAAAPVANALAVTGSSLGLGMGSLAAYALNHPAAGAFLFPTMLTAMTCIIPSDGVILWQERRVPLLPKMILAGAIAGALIAWGVAFSSLMDSSSIDAARATDLIKALVALLTIGFFSLSGYFHVPAPKETAEAAKPLLGGAPPAGASEAQRPTAAAREQARALASSGRVAHLAGVTASAHADYRAANRASLGRVASLKAYGAAAAPMPIGRGGATAPRVAAAAAGAGAGAAAAAATVAL